MSSFGEFKLLENGLGQSGYSKPNWFQTFDVGDTFKNFTSGAGDMISSANNHFKNNASFYNFAGNALSGIGSYYMQNKTANEAKRMNDYYKHMYDRQMKNEDEAKKSFQYGFQLSNANKPTYS